MKAYICDICKKKIVEKISFEDDSVHYYVFIKKGRLNHERPGRSDRLRYNRADVCMDCLKKGLNFLSEDFIAPKCNCCGELTQNICVNAKCDLSPMT